MKGYPARRMESSAAATLPVTTFAVLGQLARGPASGYEIQARLRASAAHFWHASYSQVYAELRRLAGLGYATERAVRQERRPDKREYAITPQGEAALAGWLEEEWGLAHIRDASLVKLMLADPLPPERVVAQLERLRAAHERRRREFERQIADLPPDAGRYLRYALRKGVHAQQAFAAWCTEVIEDLSADPPGPPTH
ncbi:MAG: PadR family transcriptional regulator [Actinomycetota bacterium]